MAIKKRSDKVTAGDVAASAALTDQLYLYQGSDLAKIATLTQVRAALMPAGTVSAVGVRVGDDDTGFYQTTGKLHVAIEGVEALRGGSVGIACGAGFDATDALHVRRTGGAARIRLEGEGATNVVQSRFSTDASAPRGVWAKHRGTIATPSGIAQNDAVMDQLGQGYASGALRDAVQVISTVVAATPSSTDMESDYEVRLCAAGSATLTAALKVRLATGLTVLSRVIVDQDGGFQLRSRTVAELGSLTPTAGREFYCSDESGGAVPVFGDGTNWRRVTDRAIVT